MVLYITKIYKFMNNYNDNLNQYYRINKLHAEISQNA